MIQSTTALRKICRLNKRIWGIQGGQGAGKTFSILLVILDYAIRFPGKEIYVVSSELSKMRDTVLKDCVKIAVELKVNCRFTGVDFGSPRVDFPNKSFIRFIGLDKVDVGKGLRSDLVFINEANKVAFEPYRELTGRAKRVIIDFNPNQKFWFHTEIMIRHDCDYLNLTYLDNEYLSPEERAEILMYKSKGYDGDKVINTYWANMWKVYGMGEIGQVEGRIYNWVKIPYSQYAAIAKEKYYYCDWGKVHPWAIGEAKFYDGELYVHELNYSSENELERTLSPEMLKSIKAGDSEEHEGLVGWMFKKCQVPQDRPIVCDSNRPNKIRSLRRSGWEMAIGVGGKLDMINRVSMLSAINIYYTDTSSNIDMEQENYAYEPGTEKPIDANNHHIDGITYLTQFLFNQGIIKSV